MAKVRLQKLLAEAGVASRRKAEELTRQGRVTVNGVKVTSMGFKADWNDDIRVDGKRVKPQSRKVYIMFHKPEGVVTTVKDQFERRTVLDFIKGINDRIYPVGRLDYNTSGLLLLTNDGNFSFMLTHPSYQVKKVYIAELEGVIKDGDSKIMKFESGLKIGGYITSPARFKVLKTGKDSTTVEITIHEGRNRQVRKMCEAIGNPVKKLKRIAIGSLQLGKLPEGKWRCLSKQEVENLLKCVVAREVIHNLGHS